MTNNGEDCKHHPRRREIIERWVVLMRQEVVIRQITKKLNHMEN